MSYAYLFIQALNLAETKLSSIPEGLFHALPSLKSLILSGNRFEKVPEEMERAIHLEYLNLNDNPIKTLGAESFSGLTALKGLNISAMPFLESIGINTFTPLQSMIHLWCSYNPMLRRFHRGAFNNMGTSDGTLKLREVIKENMFYLMLSIIIFLKFFISFIFGATIYHPYHRLCYPGKICRLWTLKATHSCAIAELVGSLPNCFLL